MFSGSALGTQVTLCFPLERVGFGLVALRDRPLLKAPFIKRKYFQYSGLNVRVSANSRVGILRPSVLGLGGGAFGR